MKRDSAYQFAVDNALNQCLSIGIARIVPRFFCGQIGRQQIKRRVAIGVEAEFRKCRRRRVLHQEAGNAEMATSQSVMEAVPVVLRVVEQEIDGRGGQEEAENLDLIEFTANHRAALTHFVEQVEVRWIVFVDLLDKLQISAAACIEQGE